MRDAFKAAVAHYAAAITAEKLAWDLAEGGLPDTPTYDPDAWGRWSQASQAVAAARQALQLARAAPYPAELRQLHGQLRSAPSAA